MTSDQLKQLTSIFSSIRNLAVSAIAILNDPAGTGTPADIVTAPGAAVPATTVTNDKVTTPPAPIDQAQSPASNVNGPVAAPFVPTPQATTQNMRIDPPLPLPVEGQSVLMPKTNHILSLPRPDMGETFVGYCGRVSRQCGGSVSKLGELFLGTETIFKRFGGFHADDAGNWPSAADFFFNRRSYFTPEELKDDDERAARWGAHDNDMAAHRPAGVTATKMAPGTTRTPMAPPKPR